MLNEVKAVLSRSSATIVEDSLGVASLFLALMTALTVPGLI